MNAPAVSLLCRCGSPLVVTTDVATGTCVSCRSVALNAVHVAIARAKTVRVPALQAEIARQRKPLVWDYLAGRTLIAAVSYEGDEVEHATYSWSREEGLVEHNGRLHSEAVDALRNDLESGRHMYRGDVPRAERMLRVEELQDAADHGEVWAQQMGVQS